MIRCPLLFRALPPLRAGARIAWLLEKNIGSSPHTRIHIHTTAHTHTVQCKSRMMANNDECCLSGIYWHVLCLHPCPFPYPSPHCSTMMMTTMMTGARQAVRPARPLVTKTAARQSRSAKMTSGGATSTRARSMTLSWTSAAWWFRRCGGVGGGRTQARPGVPAGSRAQTCTESCCDYPAASM